MPDLVVCTKLLEPSPLPPLPLTPPPPPPRDPSVNAHATY